MDKPSWTFWKEWKERGNDFPPRETNCPRCGEYMDGGFWMHLCPDSVKLATKPKELGKTRNGNPPHSPK